MKEERNIYTYYNKYNTRINNTRILTKNKTYPPNNDEYCEFCAEKNTIFHSIIYFEKYKSYRCTLIPEIENYNEAIWGLDD